MASPLKRRWMQFSLRTGLIFMTALCVALSLWVVPLERKRRAVAAIEAMGASVYYADDESTADGFVIAFLRRWFPSVYFDDVTVVNLGELQVTDAGLAHVQGLTSLQWLSLYNSKLTDAGLPHLQRLTNLQVLYLTNTQVTDAGLAHLQGLTGLRGVWLDKTQVTDAGLAQLRKALPNCSTIVGP